MCFKLCNAFKYMLRLFGSARNHNSSVRSRGQFWWFFYQINLVVYSFQQKEQLFFPPCRRSLPLSFLQTTEHLPLALLYEVKAHVHLFTLSLRGTSKLEREANSLIFTCKTVQPVHVYGAATRQKKMHYLLKFSWMQPSFSFLVLFPEHDSFCWTLNGKWKFWSFFIWEKSLSMIISLVCGWSSYLLQLPFFHNSFTSSHNTASYYLFSFYLLLHCS